MLNIIKNPEIIHLGLEPLPPIRINSRHQRGIHNVSLCFLKTLYSESSFLSVFMILTLTSPTVQWMLRAKWNVSRVILHHGEGYPDNLTIESPEIYDDHQTTVSLIFQDSFETFLTIIPSVSHESMIFC
jgi:hypothetical protein